MRLDKFLVEMGLGSRTEVKRLLKKRQVLVNGKIETSAKIQIDENQDEISVNKRVLDYEKFVYYLLINCKNKCNIYSNSSSRASQEVL